MMLCRRDDRLTMGIGEWIWSDEQPTARLPAKFGDNGRLSLPGGSPSLRGPVGSFRSIDGLERLSPAQPKSFSSRTWNDRSGSKAEVALSILHVRSSPMSGPLRAE